MRYYIDGNLGNGGFSRIYRGVDVDAKKPVAIKIYHRDRNFSDEYITQILTNSIKTHRLLNPESSRFPKLYDHTDRILVMEFVDGVDLGSLEFQTDVEALATGYQLAICLSEFHGTRPKNPPVHRDIKPKNIITRQNGELVLCDFDLAVIDENSVDGTDRITGTTEFLSPEQIQGTPVLPISDLFSVGSTLYNLVTGDVLREYTSPLPIEQLIESALSDLKKGDVKEIIQTCWRLGQRYESAEHMTNELAERMKRIGIDPEKSHDILAGFVRRSA